MKINLISYGDVLDGSYGLVLTANNIEKDAVNTVLGKGIRVDVGIKTQGSTISFMEPHILLHITGEPGGSSDKSVGFIARHILSGILPKPAFVILNGVCWGNPGRVSVGDVIIATSVASLNHQREHTEGRVYRRDDIDSKLKVENSLLDDTASGGEFSHHKGVIGSAEIYFSADEPRNALINQHPDLLGGEMEAYGFIANLKDIPWAVVKGVSDDAGDTTNRDPQKLVAARAATLMSALIQELTSKATLPMPTKTPPRSALIDAIIGDSIIVNSVSDAAHLNDHLNDNIGPSLERRLQRYVSDDASQQDLHRALLKLILEVIQNALRHGNASRVTLTFYETRIDLVDDGEHFDLRSLAGNRGGAIAWEDFDEYFVRPGMAGVNYKKASERRGNHYVYSLA